MGKTPCENCPARGAIGRFSKTTGAPSLLGLQNWAYGAYVVSLTRVNAEVPNGLVDVGGRKYLHQSVFADGQGLIWSELEPVLAGHHFGLCRDHVLALGDRSGRAYVNSTDDANRFPFVHAHNRKTR